MGDRGVPVVAGWQGWQRRRGLGMEIWLGVAGNERGLRAVGFVLI